jgi:hypothetical protein
MAVDGIDFEMSKATAQAFFECKLGKEMLEHNETGVGSQGLGFESQFHRSGGFTDDASLAMSHSVVSA